MRHSYIGMVCGLAAGMLILALTPPVLPQTSFPPNLIVAGVVFLIVTAVAASASFVISRRRDERKKAGKVGFPREEAHMSRFGIPCPALASEAAGRGLKFSEYWEISGIGKTLKSLQQAIRSRDSISMAAELIESAL